VLLAGQDFERPGVGADHRYTEGDKVLGAFDAEAGLGGTVPLVVLADELEPASVEQHDVALSWRLDPLLLQRSIDLGTFDRSALLDRVAAEVSGHVENDDAGGDRWHVLDPELGEAIDLGEVGGLVAVVVDVVDPEVAQAVDLRANPDPAGDDVV